MPVFPRVALPAVLLLWASTALADGLEPGLWTITTWTQLRGVMGPPNKSMKCLTPEQTGDLATTFSPISRTVNSECAPIERSLTSTTLSWKLVCKGQLDMELTGDFTFDTPHHYTAALQSKATMAGMQIVDTRSLLEGEWVSQCEGFPPAPRNNEDAR